MTRIEESISLTEQSTFGRDGAMFEGLLGFVAQLSVALWSLVILTAVIRFVGMRIYRHAAARRALVEPEAAPIAAVPATAVTSAKVPLGAPRTRRAEPLRPAHSAHVPSAHVPSAHVPSAHAPSAHAAHAPALTADSVEA